MLKNENSTTITLAHSSAFTNRKLNNENIHNLHRYKISQCKVNPQYSVLNKYLDMTNDLLYEGENKC